MDEQMIRTLIHEATSARRQAYAPYSHFCVGAGAPHSGRKDLQRLQHRKRSLHADELRRAYGIFQSGQRG